MLEGAYSALFRGYDRLNSETDYSAWADFICEAFKRYGDGVESVLDMGCGTGPMTFELHSRGYDMTALDISPEMLSVAQSTAAEQGRENILWLCQDMREFELYGTVNAAVCCLDGINHLTGSGDLHKCVSLVHNYLDPRGVFVFDVNTPHKFLNFYGNNDYILEDEGVMCCWQNEYDKKSGICNFYLSVFEQNENGSWDRTDALQKERCFSRGVLERTLTRNGFEVCGVFGDWNFGEPSAECDRWYIVARVCDK